MTSWTGGTGVKATDDRETFIPFIFTPGLMKDPWNQLLGPDPLLPPATGTQFGSKWGPNGDPILSQMGT